MEDIEFDGEKIKKLRKKPKMKKRKYNYEDLCNSNEADNESDNSNENESENEEANVKAKKDVKRNYETSTSKKNKEKTNRYYRLHK